MSQSRLVAVAFFVTAFAFAGDEKVSNFRVNYATKFGSHYKYPGDVPGQQNELARIQQTLSQVPAGGILSLGAEEPFTFASLVPQAQSLAVLEFRGGVLAYSLANIGLIRLSDGDVAKYRALRLNAEHAEWHQAVARNGSTFFSPAWEVLQNAAFFDWWAKEARPTQFVDHNAFAHLFQFEFGQTSDRFETDLSYVYSQGRFDKLAALVLDRKVYVRQAAEVESAREVWSDDVALKIIAKRQKEWGVPISVINLGIDAFKDRERTLEILEGLRVLQDVLHPDAVVVNALPRRPDYYGAGMAANRGLYQYFHYGMPIAKLWDKNVQDKFFPELFTLVEVSVDAGLYGTAVSEVLDPVRFHQTAKAIQDCDAALLAVDKLRGGSGQLLVHDVVDTGSKNIHGPSIPRGGSKKPWFARFLPWR